MNREELLKIHTEVSQKAFQIMEMKNKDYSSGKGGVFQNFAASEVIGIKPEQGLLVRVLDKICRIKTFITEGKLNVINETFEDAVLDIINYMILIYAMYIEKKRTIQSSAVEAIFNTTKSS